MEEAVRLDKWLWAARLFKTRSVAREAINGGKVHLNGHRVKPGRNLNVGDQLSVQRGQDTYQIEVLGLSSRRGPASVAQLLYQESEASREKREKQAEQRKYERQANAGPERRPDKRQRRKLVRFKHNME